MTCVSLGVDPGKDGGAALLAPDGRPLALWRWTAKRGGYVLTNLLSGNQRGAWCSSAGRVGAGIVCATRQRLVDCNLETAPLRLTVEAIHKSPKMGIASFASYCVTAGKMTGPLELLAGAETPDAICVKPPTPGTWRAKVLGKGNLKTSDAKAAAVAHALAKLGSIAQSKAFTHHVAEAYCIALYGQQGLPLAHHGGSD